MEAISRVMSCNLLKAGCLCGWSRLLQPTFCWVWKTPRMTLLAVPMLKSFLFVLLGSALFHQLLLTMKMAQMSALLPPLHRICNETSNNALILQIVNLPFVFASPSCPSVFMEGCIIHVFACIPNSNFYHSAILS